MPRPEPLTGDCGWRAERGCSPHGARAAEPTGLQPFHWLHRSVRSAGLAASSGDRSACHVYGVDSDMRDLIESFRTFDEFFGRALKVGARPIDPRPGIESAQSMAPFSMSGVSDGRIDQVKENYPR